MKSISQLLNETILIHAHDLTSYFTLPFALNRYQAEVSYPRSSASSEFEGSGLQLGGNNEASTDFDLDDDDITTDYSSSGDLRVVGYARGPNGTILPPEQKGDPAVCTFMCTLCVLFLIWSRCSLANPQPNFWLWSRIPIDIFTYLLVFIFLDACDHSLSLSLPSSQVGDCVLSVNAVPLRGLGVARAMHLVEACARHAHFHNHPVIFELEAGGQPWFYHCRDLISSMRKEA